MNWDDATPLLNAKLDPENGCLIWQKGQNGNGYGKLRFRGRSEYAHRAAWIIQKGEIPDGVVLDHTCRNRACINVNHLEAVTNAENIRRGKAGHHMKHGGAPRGDQSPAAKINSKTVRSIKALLAQGKKQASVAEQFGVSQATISQISRGVTWRHIS